MSQQLRILAAAAQLERFTAYDLAAATGTNSNTVRSVLRRHPELFAVTTAPGTPRSRGRPTNRYIVADADGLRGQLGDVRDSLEWTAMPKPDGTTIDRLTARLDVAENSLRRALTTDRKDDRQQLIGVAVEAADSLLTESSLPADLRRRALGLRATGEVLSIRHVAAANLQHALHGVAKAIAAIVDDSPLTVLVLLRALLRVTQQLRQAPPVGVITHSDSEPRHLLCLDPGARWTHWSLRETGEWLWSPAWSAPLAEHFALAGVVLRVDDDARKVDIGASLSALREWTPTIVIGESSAGLIEEATREGAMFLPSSIEEVNEPAVVGIGTALDQRIAGFEADEGSVIPDIMSLWQEGGLLAIPPIKTTESGAPTLVRDRDRRNRRALALGPPTRS